MADPNFKPWRIERQRIKCEYELRTAKSLGKASVAELKVAQTLKREMTGENVRCSYLLDQSGLIMRRQFGGLPPTLFEPAENLVAVEILWRSTGACNIELPPLFPGA